ncbi:metallophosphoesterase [Cryobacterium sp. LW097]|uniref:metallophosphoesterase family protein n=1 Tax=Cryobacterium sp. LW097 TaxID=1978566 RepID=UPI001246BCE3|nr:metallophosphoesterase [Cryobacterium sp. LW097]
MTEAARRGPLSTATRIGFLGDVHGDLQHVLVVARTMAALGIEQLVVLGDFGFLWPGHNWGIDVDKLSRRLASMSQTIAFVDGNHESFDLLYTFPLSDDGLRWIRPNIVHIPRGYRTVLASGATLAALGGANSIDIGHRVLGRSIWAEESITEADLVALGHDHADILLGHDAPLHVPTLDANLTATDRYWPVAGLKYAAAGRAMFHRGFLQVQPKLYLGGHYHQHIDEDVAYATGHEEFRTRVVLLDQGGTRSAISQAILDVHTLELEYLARDGESLRAESTGHSGHELSD